MPLEGFLFPSFPGIWAYSLDWWLPWDRWGHIHSSRRCCENQDHLGPSLLKKAQKTGKLFSKPEEKVSVAGSIICSVRLSVLSAM